MNDEPVHRIIAGYGRSGTTWVQDVLAKSNLLRAVFEPLHPLHMSGAEAHAHRFICENRDEPELYRYLHRFFCEDFHSLWVDYRVIGHHLSPRLRDLNSWHNCRQRLRRYLEFKDNYVRFHQQRRYPQRIVKLIRANMMLPWLQANFGARIVFIIRHPAAVISSQMSAQGAWHPYAHIDRYRGDADLLNILDAQTRQLLLRSVGDVEAFTLCWCIENMVALEHAQKCRIPVIFYEKLVQGGIPEWRRIMAALGLMHLPDEQLINEPSQQTWGEKATDPALLLRRNSWMETIDNSVSDRIQNVLDATGMTVYSVDDPLPVGEWGVSR